jgi:hypothetical protein
MSVADSLSTITILTQAMLLLSMKSAPTDTSSMLIHWQLYIGMRIHTEFVAFSSESSNILTVPASCSMEHASPGHSVERRVQPQSKQVLLGHSPRTASLGAIGACHTLQLKPDCGRHSYSSTRAASRCYSGEPREPETHCAILARTHLRGSYR